MIALLQIQFSKDYIYGRQYAIAAMILSLWPVWVYFLIEALSELGIAPSCELAPIGGGAERRSLLNRAGQSAETDWMVSAGSPKAGSMRGASTSRDQPRASQPRWPPLCPRPRQSSRHAICVKPSC